MAEEKENKAIDEIPIIPAAGSDEIRTNRHERDRMRRKRITDVLELSDRVKLLERVLLKSTRKGWQHPIHVAAFSNYHRCAACGGEFEDEVVMVVERTRSGDCYHVFCSKQCIANYEGW